MPLTSRPARAKNICPACIFLLHAETTPVFCTCELASPQRRKRDSLRRTRVKIEFDICSRALPLPRYPGHQKESCKTDALASRCGHFFHGVGRNVRHRRNHSWRRLRTRNLDSAPPARVVEPANRVHDRGTFQRFARGGRLLCLGAARHGELLGIPGSLAVAGGQHF